MKGGLSDLYVFDLKTGHLEQVTNDRYAQLQPAWSPDGQTFAFVTDSGPLTDFDRLTYSPMQVALMDMNTRHAPAAAAVRWPGQEHQPAVRPDGQSLYFVSDQDG